MIRSRRRCGASIGSTGAGSLVHLRLLPSRSPSRSSVRVTALADGWRRRDALVLAVVALAVRLPALLADRHLTFDDGVYGASAVAMRDGGAPFREVFSSQGPLWLPLVWLGDLVGGSSLNAPRATTVVAGVSIVVLVHRLGCALGGRRSGLIAGALVAGSGSVVWVSGPLHADAPAIAFATAAVLAGWRLRNAPSTALAARAGLLLGLAVAVKSVALPAVVPIAVVLLAQRRVGRILVAAAVSVAVVVACALPWGIDDVVDQALTYHTEAAGPRTPGRNVAKLTSTTFDRDLFVGVAALAAVGFAALRFARRSAATPSPDRSSAEDPAGADAAVDARIHGAGNSRWWSPPGELGYVACWAVATLVLLSLINPLWRPHLSHLVVPLALVVALRPPPLRLFVAIGIVTVPLDLLHVRDVSWPAPYDAEEQRVVDRLADLPPGAWAISDEPGFVWRAGRRTPDDLVDASIVRIHAGRLDSSIVADAASDPRVCAVVQWSPERFGSLATLGLRLQEMGFALEGTWSNDRHVYVRSDCRPGA